MKCFKMLRLIVFVLAGLGILCSPVLADPSADFRYAETDLGGGYWQYEYTLFNTSDPVANPGVDLYDAFFSFSGSAVLSGFALPDGWDLMEGAGFAEALSTFPGTPPDGCDIAPAAFLSGFVFEFGYRAGNLGFTAMLTNPDDPGNPFTVEGTSSPMDSPIPVPEPATAVTICGGLVMLLARSRRRARCAVALGLAAVLIGLAPGVTTPAQAQSRTYSFVKIADTGTPMPLLAGYSPDYAFGSFGPPSIDGDHVAFWGCSCVEGCAHSGQEGIYLYQGGTITRIADRDTPMISTGPLMPPMLFYGLSNPSVSGGVVAFAGGNPTTPVPMGIYLGSGGGLTTVADKTTSIPKTQETIKTFGEPSLDNGNVVFTTVFPYGTKGVYASVGGALSVVADSQTAIPGGTGTFSYFWEAAISGTNVAFEGEGPNGQNGIYAKTSTGLSLVADRNTAIPDAPAGQDHFTDFDRPSVAGQDVVFSGFGWSGYNGLFMMTGGSLLKVADRTTLVPDQPPYGFISVGGYGSPAIENGEVVFTASCAVCIGIYSEYGGSLQKVIDTTDPLNGKTLWLLKCSREGLSNGRIGFQAWFTDGSQGVFVASPQREGDSGGSAWVHPCDLLANVHCIPGPEPVPSGLNRALALVAGSPSHLSQRVNVPSASEPLEFDYRFQSTQGTLSVSLDGREIFRTDAPASLGTEFIRTSVPVPSDLLGRTGVILDFVLDGPAGSAVLVDNVAFPELVNGSFETADLSGWIATASGTGAAGVVSVEGIHVSGGAYNYPETARYHASFSMDVTGQTAASGWLKYNYSRTRMYLLSTAITQVSVSGATASISGCGKVNGADGYTFTATVAAGAPDAFGLTIYKPDGTLYYSAAVNPVTGGNLDVSTF